MTPGADLSSTIQRRMMSTPIRSALFDALFWAGYCVFGLSMSAAFASITSGSLAITLAL